MSVCVIRECGKLSPGRVGAFCGKHFWSLSQKTRNALRKAMSECSRANFEGEAKDAYAAAVAVAIEELNEREQRKISQTQTG